MADLDIPSSEQKPTSTKPGKSPFASLIDFMSSLELTVLLLVLSIILIFAGTLAQVDYGVWTVVKDYFRSFVAWVDLQIFFPRDRVVPGKIPIPGGWTLGGLLLLNLLAAHLVKFKFSKAKLGILIIHAGLILLLIGEAMTGIMAREGKMSITEGSSSNYSEDIRHSEIALIDPSDPNKDLVTVIPENKIRKTGRISHEFLPFDIQIDKYMKNSALQRASDGKGWVAQEASEIAGANAAENRIDMPSVHVSLHSKNGDKEFGSQLLSTWLNTPQPISVDGKEYLLSLRFSREYKPYRLHLQDFRFDRYMGTDIPKNFSSTIRLVDPEKGIDRKVNIWMNHPLRYRGDTFYQASFSQDETGTVLQVVKNPSWLIPYISCIVVTLGLILQFGIGLKRSLKRRKRKVA